MKTLSILLFSLLAAGASATILAADGVRCTDANPSACPAPPPPPPGLPTPPDVPAAPPAFANPSLHPEVNSACNGQADGAAVERSTKDGTQFKGVCRKQGGVMVFELRSYKSAN